jgi:outer membrane receptor protein involved in Fe transport
MSYTGRLARFTSATLSMFLSLSLPGQQTPPPDDQAPDSDDVVVLSPFEVSTERDQGYYAENTLAGSRLRSNIGDLAASISVVTKQQMTDTASIDMNDVFLYEANTEGTGNFTDFNVDTRGALQDRNAGFQGGAPSLPFGPSTSNRVRGLGSADRLRDFYPSNARIPFDIYNTDSVEINRGPNSLLFGLGSAAGIVNQSAAKADPSRRFGEVNARIGNNSSWRASFTYNLPLIQDKLAIYIGALRDERGFEREPSYDETDRYYGALTFRPFQKTTIRASFERYENRNRRPNYISPRDFVSPWIAAGRPSFDAAARTLTVNGAVVLDDLGNPRVFNPAVGDDVTALQDLSGSTVQFFGNNRPVLAIDDGVIDNFTMTRTSSTPNVAGVPAAFNVNGLFNTTRSQGPVTRMNQIAGLPAGITFGQPGVTDKSIYDWESINIISGNFGDEKADIFNVELEQEILPNLHLQLGWYREDFRQNQSYFISQQTGVTLYVDTTAVLVDGTPNPNFGRPFIEVTQPDRFEQPEDNQTYRATLAYELDLTKHDNALKWLGRHTIMGLLQRNEIDREQLRYRPYISSNHIFNPVVADVWAGNTFQNAQERRFFLGGTDGLVTHDPGLFPNGEITKTLRWLNPITNAWEETPVQESEALHFVSSRSVQEIDSKAVSLQSFLFQDRLVTTIGFREDESTAASTAGLTRLPNGLTDLTNLNNFNAPQEVSGDTHSYGAVLRPFKGWSAIESAADGGNFFADLFRNMSFTYNESTNFSAAPVQTDFEGNFLPLPTGDGKDYGVAIALFDNKLVARLNFFEASGSNARNALAGQILSRTQTIDDTIFRGWAQQAVTGLPPDQGAASAVSPEVLAILQLPPNLASQPAGVFFNTPVGSTSTVESEGMEFQLTYNPTRNWTMKVTAGQQETTFAAIAPELDAWLAQRLPLWESVTAPGITPFWQITGTELPNVGIGATQTVADWFFTNVQAVANTAKRNEGKATQGQREWRWNFITNYQFTEGRFENLSVGLGLRWEGEAIAGYEGSAPDPDGIIRSLDVDKPLFDDSQFHVDFWIAYLFKTTPWLGDKVSTKLQFNVRDATESGGLEPVAFNPDGTAFAYRIKDPRQFFLSATLSF